ncbi:MAG: family 16 glycoside hydrolase [Nitritalea sp.]
MKKKMILGMCLAGMLAACGPERTEEVDAESAELADATDSDWISLFNGQDLSGWRKYGGEPVGAAWKVKEGVLYLDASNKDGWQTGDGGDIITEESFDDFHLRLEWKISENGNSGIMFLVHESDDFQYPWMTGPEMQILDNDGHPDGQIRTHRAGDLYDLIEASEEAAKPVGEWNLAEVIVQDEQLSLKLNGVLVVQTSLWDTSWEELIAGSKFKDMSGFGSFKSGRIALQDHGDDVWFRNIEVKRL